MPNDYPSKYHPGIRFPHPIKEPAPPVLAVGDIVLDPLDNFLRVAEVEPDGSVSLEVAAPNPWL